MRQRSEKPQMPTNIVGTCTYVNNFSSLEECRTYLGSWTPEQATEDCSGRDSEVLLGESCQVPDFLGRCLLPGKDGLALEITFPGSDKEECGSVRTGCEVFAGGYFEPSATCGGDVGAGTGLPAFEPAVRVCRDPKEGEGPGQSAGGQVCTWQVVSGATEEGRNFEDYAACDPVRTQRPYYGSPEDPTAALPDARMDDAAYVAEMEWVRRQVRSSACVCCHANSAPKGASNWNVDKPGNFVNGFKPRGIALGAGWIDSVGFGTFPPEENNGFHRPTPENPVGSIIPTTDPARMMAFFEREAAHRGMTREDFADEPYGGGPLDEQRFYVPGACKEGEGIDADGTIRWRFGTARYLYVLEAGAPSPTVPPNLDLPVGTLWRTDLPVMGTPIASGAARYGQVPAGMSQRFPVQGAPPALIKGRQYYLYVLADVAVPIARCLFNAQ